jgi:hypothetical protein
MIIHNTKLENLICFLNNPRYYTREDAENAIRYINGTRLDDRIVRTDWDAGFKEGKQYGRGKSGGQVRIYILMSCFKDISLCFSAKQAALRNTNVSTRLVGSDSG